MATTQYDLKKLYMEREIYAGLPPLLTNRAICQAANESLRAFERLNREKILNCVKVDNFIVDEARDDILNAVPTADLYPMGIVRAPAQTDESFDEQRLAFNICQNSIERFSNPNTVFEPSILLTGPPGAGKTYLFQKLILYSLLRGLRIAVTAIMSERARVLGGEHFHWLFGIPVTPNSLNENAQTLALKTITALGTRPQRAAFLKRLDILFFDEIGQLSGEMLTVMDIILRNLRGVEQPMGGVLIVSTG